MGLANWLTILRILLIPVFVTLLVYRRPGPALIVFGVAALTDLLDGWAARHWKDESSLGAFLDPMADKLLLTSSFVTLTYLKALPFWIAAVVISRDAILVFGALLIYMLGSRIRPRPTWAGKAATLFQVFTVLNGLLWRYHEVQVAPKTVLFIAAGFTVISGLQYIIQGMRFLNASAAAREESPENALYRGAGGRDRRGGRKALARGRRRSHSRRSDRCRQRPPAARRDRFPVPRGRRASGIDGRARGRSPLDAAGSPRAGSRPRAGPAAPGRHRHVREQVRVLLHPPAPEGYAPEPLREGRRLQAVVPARQLHHAQRPRRGLVRADHRAAPVAALHLGTRHRSGAPARAARPAAAFGRDPAAARAAGQGRHPDARADRAVSRPERRRASGADGPRAGAALPSRLDDGDRPGRAHPPSRAAPRAAKPRARRGPGTRDHGRGMAAPLACRARKPIRVPRRRDLSARRAPAAAGRVLRGLPDRGGRHRPGAPVRGRLPALGRAAAEAPRAARRDHGGDGGAVRSASLRAARPRRLRCGHDSRRRGAQ